MNALPPGKFSYDPFARDVLDNPIPYYAELRKNHPAYYVEKYDMFVFTRYQDVIGVLGVVDNNTFVASESSLPRPDAISQRNNGAPPLPSTNPMGPGPILPSPAYEEMRLAHIKPLRPSGVKAIESFVTNLVRERLKLLLPKKRFDIMSDYGGMVSASVTCHLYGIPLSEAEAVLEAVNYLAAFNESIEAVNTPAMFEQLKKFIIPAIQRRRKAGADGSVPIIDGMITHRVAADGRALTDDEICDQLVCAFVANTETPPKPAGQGLLALSEHPDQLAAVRADLAANVVTAAEEMLRICFTNQWAIRTAHRDVTVAGVSIKAGQRVLVSPFAANRDEREYGPTSEEFIWNRPIKRILTFGHGQHHCIGNHIARLQIRTLVREFLAAVNSFEFDLSQGKRSASYFHWGWASIPVIIKD